MDWFLYDIGLRHERVNGAEGIVRCKDLKMILKEVKVLGIFGNFKSVIECWKPKHNHRGCVMLEEGRFSLVLFRLIFFDEVAAFAEFVIQII